MKSSTRFEPLPRGFYLQPTNEVAQQLLGHFLLRRIGDELCGGLIVETEAYLVDDPACHAYVRQTTRNASMWGAPGNAYVYQIYGAHYCFNAVCQPSGVAEAVLVRAVEPTFGLETMQQFRSANTLRELTNGPAKFCAALDINRVLDGCDLCDLSSPLFIARNPQQKEALDRRKPLVTTTRIGISKAADWPLRWYLGGSDYVSRRVARKTESANAELF
jgi:DNA-3-methyladenine glycosylase